MYAPIHLATVLKRGARGAEAGVPPKRARLPPAKRASNLDGSEGLALLFVLGAVGTLVAAYLFLRFRDSASFAIGSMLAISAGMLSGSIWVEVKSRSLARDWLVVATLLFVLIAGAAYCGWLLLHPPRAPAGYAAISAAYLEEPSALNVFDDTTKLLANQGLGSFALLLAAVLILALAFALFLKAGALRTGIAPTGWRQRLIGLADSWADVGQSVFVVSLFLGIAGFTSSGLLYRLADDPDGSGLAPAKVLTPSISRSGSVLTVRLVCTRTTPVRMTVKAKYGGRLLQRSTRRCTAGNNTARLPLRRPSNALRVTLTPIPASGAAGGRRSIELD